jgi:hypothetical protein
LPVGGLALWLSFDGPVVVNNARSAGPEGERNS